MLFDLDNNGSRIYDDSVYVRKTCNLSRSRGRDRVLELQTHGAYDDDSKGQNDQHHEGIFQATRYRVSNCDAGR